ncbi:hypothetical protein [Saccharothrix sp. NRRL B-16314]|uniref:hypothetical protein n=1 Tax=Saccharothrix sp. NRRL B-16314 TaxID=1463825 RepID=UPI000527B1B7|nr:hypothetical protein [Saccharothrix sp. NRRL B-16314]
MITDPTTRRAFTDESYREASGDDKGFYVLASAVFEPGEHLEAREVLLGLRGDRSTAKLHWNEMDRHQKRTAAQRLADVEGMHLVAIGSPLPVKRQERARVACLRLMVRELHTYGVCELLIESRTNELDKRDVATVSGARYDLPKGTRFRVEHQAGAKEPLFWAADIIAGAVRAHLMGDSSYQDILSERLYEVFVDTGC